MSSQRKSFARTAMKHFFIMIAVSVLAVIGLFIASRRPTFTLHPNAYRDIVRSIAVVYIIFFISSTLLMTVLGRKKQVSDRRAWSLSLRNILDTITPYETIAVAFTILTVINSLMMLVGLDEPKQGTFAYIHLLTRWGIIALIVLLISYREVIKQLKEYDLKTFTAADFLYSPRKNLLISISKVFTHITLVYCLIMISFQNPLPATGGNTFYISLLALFAIISVWRITAEVFIKQTKKKENKKRRPGTINIL